MLGETFVVLAEVELLLDVLFRAVLPATGRGAGVGGGGGTLTGGEVKVILAPALPGLVHAPA